MAKYTPPEQSRVMQWVDIIFVVAAIFLALWLPLQAGWAGVSRAIQKIDNPDLGSPRADPGPGRAMGEARLRRCRRRP